jgi:hypothetical protein
MITIEMGSITIKATGNHPFYVLRGDRLSSRPVSKEIPKEEQGMVGPGRWVEAYDLKEGDLLKVKSGEGLIITSLSSQNKRVEVFYLEVESYHNYAVHRAGILVHNGPSTAKKVGSMAASESLPLITVYGKVILEHYEVSILGAADASALLDWLQKNGYQVNPEAEEILDTYVNQNWAFVAVKLNPGEKRHYENRFLPPLAIRYQHDRLIFPLYISSVSTAQTARITLYVIAESTVTSSNYPTKTLKYEEYLTEWVVINKYIKACIQRTMADQNGGLVVMWSGKFAQSADERKIINELIKVPFTEGKMRYLTRLETMIEPAAMTKDIRFMLYPSPNEFRVHIMAEVGYGTELTVAARDGETDTVRKLLEAGADVHAKDASGLTALMWAFRRRRYDIRGMLLDAGADVNAKDVSGLTTLMWAVQSGEAVLVHTLLQAGADVNAKDNNGGTALMKAAWQGNTYIVRALLEAGADVNAKDDDGWTTMKFTKKMKYPDIVKLLRKDHAKK